LTAVFLLAIQTQGNAEKSTKSPKIGQNLGTNLAPKRMIMQEDA
jgi:hypothetical protein